MSKRSHSEISSSQPSSTATAARGDASVTAPKRPFLSGSELVLFRSVRSLEELDKRTLQLQNKKLYEALSEKRSAISDLRQRIEQLENRQAKDDALLCVVNRYWNQLDEDCLILLQRCEVDIDEKISDSADSFLKQLASWEKEEVPEKLQQRVHFSKRIIARLLTSIERLVAHQSHLRSMLLEKAKASASQTDETKMVDEKANVPPSGCGGSNSSGKIILALREEVSLLSAENARLQNLSTGMHAKHRQQSLHVRELQDRCQANSDSADEWKAKYEDLEYKLQQSTSQLSILDHRLYDAQQAKKALEEELAAFKGTSSSPGEGSEDTSSGLPGMTKSKYNDILCELEEQRELASNRLTELEHLQRQHEEKVAECAKLSMQVNDPSEELIQESPLFRSLKVQFNILYSEIKTLRTQLDESRAIIQTVRNAHLKQVEEMEANETAILSQMKSEMMSQEELYAKLRRQFDDVEADLKQVMAHNEQVIPISSEMRSLINTLQLQNKQLKNEVYRFRRKSKEAANNYQQIAQELKVTQEELDQVRKAFSEANAAVLKLTKEMKQPTEAATTAALSDTPPSEQQPNCKSESTEPLEVKAEMTSPTSASHFSVDSSQRDRKVTTSCQSSEEIIRDLRQQLKISKDAEKEMSVLLNMYKVIPKDQRDKAALLQSESKLRSELTEVRNQLTSLQTSYGDLHTRYTHLQRECRIATASTTSVKREPATAEAQLMSNFNPDRKVEVVSTEPSPQDGHGTTITTATTDSPATTTTIYPESGEKSLIDKSTPTQAGLSLPPPPPPPPIQHPLMPPIPRKNSANLEEERKAWQVAELLLELQHTQRRCHTLEECVNSLQQQVSTAKQQEDVMLKEMEVTGQAFEDVQEQNTRLVKNLREKEDAYLNHMAECIKTNQLERLLLANLETLEKEASSRQQSQEAYKRKSVECQQREEDLRVTVQKYLAQLNEAQTSVQEKASAYEQVSFRHQRLQEEYTTLKRKYERLRKIEQSHNADEVLLAEIQDYKEQLACPTCKTHKKDAILTKCFHVFCLNCLKTRYETRNRKCPKCNATFGANDYHRIYLT
nr:E3 ubiquitin protein ligase Bre1 [Hymenolepis microstoma]